MRTEEIIIEAIGWISTLTFLVSIILPQRVSLHQLGMFTAVTTGVYGYAHGATAIWVKWLIAFFFHAYMWKKICTKSSAETQN